MCREVSETFEGFAQALCEILKPQNAFMVLHHMGLADTICNPKMRRGSNPSITSIQVISKG